MQRGENGLNIADLLRTSALLWVLLLSVIYALFLSGLSIDGFVDRDNYLVYAERSNDIFVWYQEAGLKEIFFNEPIWLIINIIFYKFLTVEFVLRAIIFFASFFLSFLVLYNNKGGVFGFIFLIFLLLLPQVLKNNIIHLRQGLAISIFLIGWFSGNKYFRYLFILMTPFIHASFFFLVLFFLMDRLYVKFLFSPGLRASFSLFFGVFLGVFGMSVAIAAGARQGSEYEGYSLEVSGLGFMFWLVVAALFLDRGWCFLRNNSFQFSILAFYLTTYFFLPVTARVFESGMILVLISCFSMHTWRKAAFLSIFIFYFCFQWYQRIGLPGFGWGIENFA